MVQKIKDAEAAAAGIVFRGGSSKDRLEVVPVTNASREKFRNYFKGSNKLGCLAVQEVI